MLARSGASVTYRSFHGDWEELAADDVEQARAYFGASPLGAELRGIDAVVVNGEGTIHHGAGRHLLTILRGAQAMGLRTHLVNAVFQDAADDLDTLRRLDDFTVRDAASSAYLTQLDVPHRVVLDSILEAAFVDEPAVDLSGKVVVTDWHTVRDHDVGGASRRLLADLGDGAVYYPLKSEERAQNWRHAVADLRAARLVVTGRHHGVCLAAMAGAPFVALGSNTWKVEGMLALLPGGLTVCTRLEELSAACREAEHDLNRFREIRHFVEGCRPLATFAALSGS
jgi:hypothetical protein